MLCMFILAFFLPLIWADCPPGTIYKSSFNKCYKFVNQRVTFLAAEQFCQGLGGHLVAVSNTFENSFVSQAVANQSTIKSYWIGANYLLDPSWSWTSNTSFSYSNWASGQPADPSINQCGAVRDSDNYWTKEICNSQKPFVCSIDPNAVPVGSPTCPPTPTRSVSTITSTGVSITSPPEPTGNLTCPKRCPANYTQSPIDCKCYYIFCESQNGSLIKITSSSQNTWLTNWLWYQAILPFPWIGLTCPGPTKDVCYWVDGSPLTGYENFDTAPRHRYDQVWNGLNPNFFIYLSRGNEGMGQWLRCNPNTESCNTSVVCMRDSQ